MKKRYISRNLPLILLAFFACLVHTSTGQVVEWAKGIGGNDDDRSNAITSDDAGNVYITGRYEGTVDFDPGTGIANLTSNGGTDIFFAKYDPDGGYLWAKSIGGTSNDEGQDIEIDNTGDIYITGSHSEGTVDFNPGSGAVNITTSTGGAFLAKYDNNGNYTWAKSFNDSAGSGVAATQALKLDNSGSVLITGLIAGGTINFNPGGTGSGNLTPIGFVNTFLAKYDIDGDYLWAVKLESNFLVQSTDVGIDASDNIYVTGYFMDAIKDPINGTPLTTSTGMNDIFLSKYDPTGTLIWVEGIGGPENDESVSIAVGSNGYLYITGGFRDTVNFNPASGQSAILTTKGNVDIFIAKYDTSGDYIWANPIGGADLDNSFAVCTDELDNVLISGFFRDTVDFDPGNDTALLLGHENQNAAVFIAKYDSSGRYLWAGATEGSRSCYPHDLNLSNSGNIHVTGILSGSIPIDFDPWVDTILLSSNGSNDMFMLKIDGCRNSRTFTEMQCDSFTFNEVTYHAGGRYVDTFTNAANCDSLVILDLTLGHTTSTTVSGQYCDSATFNGVSYYTTGVYTQYISPNVSGCDSLTIYDLTITTSKDSTLTEVACDSFTFEDTVYTISGIYTHLFVNAAGCDSAVNLDLTIGSTFEASAIKNGTTLIASASASNAKQYHWLNCDDSAIIPGAEDQEFTPTVTGSYAVIVTSDGCSDTSDCISVEVKESSITQTHHNNQLKLYPNPAWDKLNIQTPTPLREASARLVNSLGSVLIKKKHLSGSLFTLDINTLAPGVYYIEILNGGEVFRRKVVKATP